MLRRPIVYIGTTNVTNTEPFFFERACPYDTRKNLRNNEQNLDESFFPLLGRSHPFYNTKLHKIYTYQL